MPERADIRCVTTTSLDSRLLALAGADNARDLGGLPTTDGARTRRGRLFRAALIPELLPEDVDLLVSGVGLRTVVDLRSLEEAAAVPIAWHEHDIDRIHCPVYIGRARPVGDARFDYAAGYLEYLTIDPEPVLRAVRTLIDIEAQPALFHCAAGKDRTGVVTALLLDVLGVPHETIAEDYALTLAALPSILRRLSALPPYENLRTTTLEDHIPEAQTMRRFLRELHDELGGAAAWLRSRGVPGAALQAFRTEMLETV